MRSIKFISLFCILVLGILALRYSAQAQNTPLPINATEFAAAMKEPKARVVDVRPYARFGEAHIPGAINIGARGEFSDWLKRMLPADIQPLVVMEDEAALTSVAEQFTKAGIAAPLRYLRGGMPSWKGATEKLPQKNVAYLKKALDAKENLVVLDVRKDDEWQAGHIRGARHFVIDELTRKLPDLPKNQPIAVFCGSGYRSSIAASMLRAQGFTHLFNVPGGIGAWREAGYELVTGK